jgi:hypothetical protein
LPPQNDYKEKKRYIQIAEQKTSYNLQLNIENNNATLGSEGTIKLYRQIANKLKIYIII